MISTDHFVAQCREALDDILQPETLPDDEGPRELETRRRASAAVEYIARTLRDLEESHGRVVAGIVSEDFDHMLSHLMPLAGAIH